MSTPQETGLRFMTLQPIDNKNNMNNKRLSVQIALNGLSFLVSDQSGNPISILSKNFERNQTPEELLIEIENLLPRLQIDEAAFSEIKLIYATPQYSLVPNEVFDETKAIEYLKFNSKIFKNDFVAFDRIEDHDIVVVYIPFVNVNNYFFEKFGSFEYLHSSSVLTERFFRFKKEESPRMFLHFNQHHFDCLIFREDQLLFCNSFEYQTPEDFLYYTLFTMEQLELDPDTLPVYLCGSVTKDDDKFSLGFQYIRNLKFIEVENPLKAIIPDIKGHEHYLILNSFE